VSHTGGIVDTRYDRPESTAAEAPVLCIVDDDGSTVELVREVAEESGWVAYGFERIEDARRFLDARQPTLLVLDDDLPDGRGGDLARELREDPTTDVPVLVCTAAHPNRQREIGEWAPVLSKPFDIFEFERHLEASAEHGVGRPDTTG
jgi:DNA-binding response OmpR family regulator